MFDAQFVLSGHLARNLPIDMGRSAVLSASMAQAAFAAGDVEAAVDLDQQRLDAIGLGLMAAAVFFAFVYSAIAGGVLAVLDQVRRELPGSTAAEAAREGRDVLIEPINTFDVPGFYLNRTSQAISILDEVGAANACVQYDIYHAQRMEGELAATITQHLPRIGHIQLADNPGRHEPGTGEINYPFLLGFIDRVGYPGWIGCEYKPAAGTSAGLGWAKNLLA